MYLQYTNETVRVCIVHKRENHFFLDLLKFPEKLT